MYFKFLNFKLKNRVTAEIRGGPLAPKISGRVIVRRMKGGSEVIAEVYNLPPYRRNDDRAEPIGPHGFHIHEFGDCTIGDPENPFMAAGGHWNPDNEPHGNHAGDLPNLFSNNGYSFMRVYSNKFLPMDVRNRSVIIHENPDDFRTQPSGNSGKRLACGILLR
ncbi:MAG: superoxide dismutase family protein [Halanaerobiales bacterium]